MDLILIIVGRGVLALSSWGTGIAYRPSPWTRLRHRQARRSESNWHHRVDAPHRILRLWATGWRLVEALRR
jgi:hypothetical protein